MAGDYPGANPETGGAFIYQHTSDGWKLTGLTIGNSPQGSFTNEEPGLSATGSTLVAGNPSASSPAAGPVSVFSHFGSRWASTATLTASDAPAGDGFGNEVAISADGLTIVAGDESGIGLGAAYVFRKSGKRGTKPAD